MVASHIKGDVPCPPSSAPRPFPAAPSSSVHSPRRRRPPWCRPAAQAGRDHQERRPSPYRLRTPMSSPPTRRHGQFSKVSLRPIPRSVSTCPDRPWRSTSRACRSPRSRTPCRTSSGSISTPLSRCPPPEFFSTSGRSSTSWASPIGSHRPRSRVSRTTPAGSTASPISPSSPACGATRRSSKSTASPFRRPSTSSWTSLAPSPPPV